MKVCAITRVCEYMCMHLRLCDCARVCGSVPGNVDEWMRQMHTNISVCGEFPIHTRVYLKGH